MKKLYKITEPVAPARERGLKCVPMQFLCGHRYSRSREGAWIEILVNNTMSSYQYVAPARERGLKFLIFLTP